MVGQLIHRRRSPTPSSMPRRRSLAAAPPGSWVVFGHDEPGRTTWRRPRAHDQSGGRHLPDAQGRGLLRRARHSRPTTCSLPTSSAENLMVVGATVSDYFPISPSPTSSSATAITLLPWTRSDAHDRPRTHSHDDVVVLPRHRSSSLRGRTHSGRSFGGSPRARVVLDRHVAGSTSPSAGSPPIITAALDRWSCVLPSDRSRDDLDGIAPSRSYQIGIVCGYPSAPKLDRRAMNGRAMNKRAVSSNTAQP